MTKDEYTKSLSELNNAYSRAESEIKTLEVFSASLIVPAINELRYAGRHILRASEYIDKNCEDAINEISSANEHCTRAYNDVCDASIVFFLKEIRYFEEKYEISLYEVLKDYGKIREKVYTAQKFILEKRRQYNDRPKFYKESKQHAKELKNIFEQLNANKEMLERVRNRIETKKIEETKRFGRTVSFSMISIALALIAILVKVVL